MPENTYGDYNDIYFRDPMHGWIVGSQEDEPLLLATSDGGTTWDKVVLTDELQELFSVRFTDSTTAWIGGDNAIQKSDDDGKTWVTVYIDSVVSDPVRAFNVFNSKTLWTMGKALRVSRDGGSTWTSPTIPGELSEIKPYLAMFFKSPVEGWISVAIKKNRSAIMHTKNAGASWQTEQRGAQSVTGFCAAGSRVFGVSAEGKVYRRVVADR